MGIRKYKPTNKINLEPTAMTTFKKKVVTQVYLWLLREWEAHGWQPNDDLWRLCPYNNLDITRIEFDELIRQMKEEEGWK